MDLSSWQDVFLQVVQGERSHRTHRVGAPADAKAAELLHALPGLPASDLHGREVIFSTSKRVDDEAAHIRLDSACHTLPRSSLLSPLYVHVVPARRAAAGAETRAYFEVAGDEGSVAGGDEAEHLNGGACARIKMFPHRPDIDGLRALAVGALFVNHLHGAWLPGGGLGIDVCFVISGFLSAGSLLCSREIDRGALVGFYSRRILQQAPCFFTTVLTISIVLSFIVEDSDLYPSAHLALVGWANNYFVTSYPSELLERNPYAHLWAAGVQIQFYVLGPVLITIANWRGSTRLCSLILLALFAGPSLVFTSTVADHRVAYYLFPSRMWQFMAGAMVLTWKSGTEYIEVSNSCMRVAAAVELMLLVCLFLVLVHGECTLKWSLATVLCTAGLIGLGVLRPTQHEVRSAFPRCSACMSSRALVYVGQLSLPLYLWHWPVILLFKESLGLETAPLRVAAALVTLQLSMFSHYVVDASVKVCRPQCHKSVFVSATIIVLSLEGLLGLLHGPFVGSLYSMQSSHMLKAVSSAKSQEVNASASIKVSAPRRNNNATSLRMPTKTAISVRSQMAGTGNTTNEVAPNDQSFPEAEHLLENNTAWTSGLIDATNMSVPSNQSSARTRNYQVENGTAFINQSLPETAHVVALNLTAKTAISARSQTAIPRNATNEWAPNNQSLPETAHVENNTAWTSSSANATNISVSSNQSNARTRNYQVEDGTDLNTTRNSTQQAPCQPGERKASSPDARLTNACDGEWLFVFSTARAGSTTILSMLNSVPDISLSGENMDLLSDLAHVYEKTMRLEVKWEGAWFNQPNAAALRQSVCAWIRGLRVQKRTAHIHGFKEIREESIPFLISMFPDAKYIINYRRDVQAQARSNFLKFTSSEKEIVENLFRIRHNLQNQSVYELPLEDFSTDSFNQVLQWLNISHCRYNRVVHQNSYGGYWQEPTVGVAHCSA